MRILIQIVGNLIGVVSELMLLGVRVSVKCCEVTIELDLMEHDRLLLYYQTGKMGGREMGEKG